MLASGARAVRWVEGSSLDYVVGLDPTLEAPDPLGASLSHFQEALTALQGGVAGHYYAYAKTSLTGRRVELEDGSSFPLFRELYVSGTFFGARQVGAQDGRLWDEAERDAVVIGYRLAQSLFGAPQRAVGERIRLYTPGTAANTEERVIVGVLAPSPLQDPELDADDALVLPLAGRLEEEQEAPLHLFVRFEGVSEAERVVPRMRAWSRAFFGPESVAAPIDSLLQERGRFADVAIERLAVRRTTLVTFTVLLALAIMMTLYTQLGWLYARERRRLGLERALGASRRGATLAFAGGQLFWSLLGGSAGAFGLWLLEPRLGASLGGLGPALLILTALLPAPTLLILLVATLAPFTPQPVASLLRHPLPWGRARLPIYLTYGGLSLALSGGVAATQVYLHLQREASVLETRFSSLYALQTGATVLDLRSERAFEAPGAAPAFNEADVEALTSLAGVRKGSLAQTFPQLEVESGGRSLLAWTAVTDQAYMGLLGLELSQGVGLSEPGGCVVSRRVAGELGVGVGERLELMGKGSAACAVSGILAPPPALWGWLVADLPDILVSPAAGRGLTAADPTATAFRSKRVLLELVSPEAALEVESWLRETRPDVQAELLPYVPDVRALLLAVRTEAQLCLLMALLAALLSLTGIFGGGLLFLRLERSRIVLDRTLGMPTHHLTRLWWLQTLGLGSLCILAGWLTGYVLTVRLYNALGLATPGWPVLEATVLNPVLVLLTVLALLASSTAGVLLAMRWVRRQALVPLKG